MKRTTSKRLLRLLAGLIGLGIYATVHKGDSVTLAWDRSPSSNVVGYAVYARQANSNYNSGIKLGPTTSASISNLVGGTSYVFAVTAYDSAGRESDLSNEVSYNSPATSATNPPVAATLAATDITGMSATLGGLVNPQGASTWAWFQYGATTNYDISTPARDLSNGSGALAMNNPVSGLVPGAIYHFRIVATNSAGAAIGSDMSFSTPAVAPTLATQPASSINWKGATLNATINPNGTATTAYFEYGPSSTYGSRTPLLGLGSGTNTVPVNASVTGLSAGITYHFRIIASNAGGTVLGSDSTFITALRHIARK